MEGSGRSLLSVTDSAFAWRVLGKQRNLRIAGFCAEILGWDLPHMKC
jgi:hypothetical protein